MNDGISDTSGYCEWKNSTTICFSNKIPTVEIEIEDTFYTLFWYVSTLPVGIVMRPRNS